ncbi:hypothetical protein R3P38DRAFT_2809409 [Favolaschia claudopus]|uniref:Uncharacterized protein n=1 Tax=Favolaschia claudopus TaxID=2862362 RepID=A0AAV9ZDA1_9AGAR
MYGFAPLLSLFVLATVSFGHPAPSPISNPFERAAPTLPQAQILGLPISNGITPRCAGSCSLLQSALNTFTFTGTFCTQLVLSEALTCYNCLADASVFTIESLQTQANKFIASCNSAPGVITRLTPVTVVDAAPPSAGNSGSTSAGNTSGGSSGGTNTTPNTNTTDTNSSLDATPSDTKDDADDKKNAGSRISAANVLFIGTSVMMGVFLVGA